MERKEVLAVCRKYLGKNYYYRKIVNQLQEFTQDIGLTYEQIVKILDYWYDVKKQDPSKANGGIGIVPHIYKEALDYWDKQTQFQEIADNVQSYSRLEVEHVVAPSPYMVKPKTLKMFDLK